MFMFIWNVGFLKLIEKVTWIITFILILVQSWIENILNIVIFRTTLFEILN